MQVRLCLRFLFVCCKTIRFHLNCSDPTKPQLQTAPILSQLYCWASNISGLCDFCVASIVEASQENVIIVFGELLFKLLMASSLEVSISKHIFLLHCQQEEMFELVDTASDKRKVKEELVPVSFLCVEENVRW